ncbi:hypothetical protein PL263_05125 [Methylomonas sp. EFPC3]|uniref:hypothetical protein n=1 Tax=unclassified Methylomonas TaxID=2608980 RepID=UPI002415B44C|nr:hypothetical protein [Methylomonas sp. EFPC3]WFP51412.1 hypothetical protein PL263_05125 [Methylomonas sp. EFPC3]
MSTFTDAFLVNRRLAIQLGESMVWAVVRMDIDSRELLSLDYQSEFHEQQRTAYQPVSKPHVKGAIELFLGKLDRAVLMKTEAKNLDQLRYDTREFLDILRNADGKVVL